MRNLQFVLMVFACGMIYSCLGQETQIKTPGKHAQTKIDTQLIEEAYSKLAKGFEQNNFNPYYDLLADDVLVIDDTGHEVHGKLEVVNFFDKQMETVDFQLLDLTTNKLLVSEDLALGRSIYKARIYNDDKGFEQIVTANYHLIWAKDESSNWKIIQEVFNYIP